MRAPDEAVALLDGGNHAALARGAARRAGVRLLLQLRHRQRLRDELRRRARLRRRQHAAVARRACARGVVQRRKRIHGCGARRAFAFAAVLYCGDFAAGCRPRASRARSPLGGKGHDTRHGSGGTAACKERPACGRPGPRLVDCSAVFHVDIVAGGATCRYVEYGALEAAYVAGGVHPGDLKAALVAALNAILQPVRDHFEKDAGAAELLKKVKSFKVTR